MSLKTHESQEQLLWHNRYYRTQFIGGLTHDEYQLSQQLRCRVEYASVDQLAICIRMIKRASSAGDNVGTDEYPSGDSFVHLFATAELFAIRDVTSSQIVSFIAIRPCEYARGLDTCLARLYIFRAEEIADDWPAMKGLIRLAVRLTVLMDAGYAECIYSVALTNYQLFSALRAENFRVTAVLPRCVNLSKRGLTDSLVMARDLGLTARKPRSRSEVQALWGKLASQCFGPTLNALTTVDFLPRSFVFQCGVRAIVRTAVEAEIPTLFAMMSEASDQGQGYALNELVSFDYFRRVMVGENLCIVYEEQKTGNIIGFSLITDSWFSRTELGQLGESDTYVNKSYRGRHIGAEIVLIELTIMRQTGRTAGINDTMISNSQMLSIIKQDAAIIVGTIHKAAYHPQSEADGEWEDVLVQYYDFSRLSIQLTFSELADDNEKQSSFNSKL